MARRNIEPLKAPFPWFGGKSRVADLVWQRFGNPINYVEPFAGSLAVLLARPHPQRIETVNDLDSFIANFWRALAFDPEGVAQYADWPVNETDLQARHQWLVNQTELRERMKSDPDYYDSKIAGWWVWGISCWIGSVWCNGANWKQLPNLRNYGKGVHRKRPHLNYGTGVHRKTVELHEYMYQLAARLRNVRVCCGDWSRILGPSPTVHCGLTGVFLDPPYSADRDHLYSEESFTVAHDVREWAIANGDNPLLRIALCGYEGEHEMPAGWEVIAWKTGGGYGNLGNGKGKDNKHRERIWFSPHCLGVNRQSSLF